MSEEKAAISILSRRRGARDPFTILRQIMYPSVNNIEDLKKIKQKVAQKYEELYLFIEQLTIGGYYIYNLDDFRDNCEAISQMRINLSNRELTEYRIDLYIERPLRVIDRGMRIWADPIEIERYERIKNELAELLRQFFIGYDLLEMRAN